MAGDNGEKTKVLFVCLGNICRSPSAEAVFKDVVEKAGVSGQFEIDSCGTGGGSSNWYLPGGFSYHEGDPADGRMTATARTRGVTLTSRSRPLRPSDLEEFDYIVGMDAANLAAIRRAAEHWRGAGGGGAVPPDYGSKLSLMTDFLRSQQFAKFNEVPDPYYGGQKGFDLVLDLLDDACKGLLATIQDEQPQR
ncbi:tyrosine phosphatase [Micractinium conductrix]|uniref:Tyrosine phosphatase n=1 Tax=Micractinium conductrix TaxID=554055 RepID=A0A2P6VF53_9CHLO|nr:tyrosine phosphatase [Micractinium conductrix]|eukprot:PSC72725.1 tyrosine phosphatase [Micractinium conductrix]